MQEPVNKELNITRDLINADIRKEKYWYYMYVNIY